ncbi:hypothetical protein L837_1884 [Mycobacterium avium MAV_061107_1842]|nr:hypothetical protein L837_1884 [Mycobacterium avium MAV_061107_1842]
MRHRFYRRLTRPPVSIGAHHWAATALSRGLRASPAGVFEGPGERI